MHTSGPFYDGGAGRLGTVVGVKRQADGLREGQAELEGAMPAHLPPLTAVVEWDAGNTGYYSVGALCEEFSTPSSPAFARFDLALPPGELLHVQVG